MHLDLDATIQAAGVLLERARASRMSSLRLLKLLYLADREMLLESGRPITFDRFAAFRHGPAPVETNDLLRGQHAGCAKWSAHFSSEGYETVLVSPPGCGLLSKLAIGVLSRVQDEVAAVNDWELIDHLKSRLPEWRASSVEGGEPIELLDILGAIGVDREEAEEIDREIRSRRSGNRLAG